MNKKRVGLIVTLFFLAFVVILIRIIGVSLFPDPRLIIASTESDDRGTIYDRNGNEIALTVDSYSFYARTKNLSDEVKVFLFDTFEAFGYFSDSELEKFYSESSFIWIKRRMPEEDMDVVQLVIDELKNAEYIEEDDLGLLKEDGRFYSHASTVGITGYVGVDNQGLMGIEYSLNDYLEDGYFIETTIDSDISDIVYEELQNTVIEYGAEFGSVGILDVENNEILALVGYPSFDPNDLSEAVNSENKPWAVSAIYEPGSVMKQFSAAFALEKQYATPESPVYTCEGSIELGEVTVTCAGSHWSVNLSQIIQKSCNVGMVQIAKNFKNSEFRSFLTNLGFGQRFNIPLTDMESGILRTTDNWSYLSKYMIAYGQEIGVTTLQLLTASSVIANDGFYQTPVLVKNVYLDNETNNIYNLDRDVRMVFSETNAEQLLEILQTVVSEDGTAIRAKVEGIDIAGKTGTGQVADEDGGGYYSDLFNAVFIGYVPAKDPQLVIVVSINQPSGYKHTGGAVAAPAFASIVRRIITTSDYIED